MLPTDCADRPSVGVGSWTVRRRFMFIVIAFCMGVVSYCLWQNLESRVAETAVMSAFFVIGTTIGSYVFGAAWQDISSIRRTGGM